MNAVALQGLAHTWRHGDITDFANRLFTSLFKGKIPPQTTPVEMKLKRKVQKILADISKEIQLESLDAAVTKVLQVLRDLIWPVKPKVAVTTRHDVIIVKGGEPTKFRKFHDKGKEAPEKASQPVRRNVSVPQIPQVHALKRVKAPVAGTVNAYLAAERRAERQKQKKRLHLEKLDAEKIKIFQAAYVMWWESAIPLEKEVITTVRDQSLIYAKTVTETRETGFKSPEAAGSELLAKLCREYVNPRLVPPRKRPVGRSFDYKPADAVWWKHQLNAVVALKGRDNLVTFFGRHFSPDMVQTMMSELCTPHAYSKWLKADLGTLLKGPEDPLDKLLREREEQPARIKAREQAANSKQKPAERKKSASVTTERMTGLNASGQQHTAAGREAAQKVLADIQGKTGQPETPEAQVETAKTQPVQLADLAPSRTLEEPAETKVTGRTRKQEELLRQKKAWAAKSSQQPSKRHRKAATEVPKLKAHAVPKTLREKAAALRQDLDAIVCSPAKGEVAEALIQYRKVAERMLTGTPTRERLDLCETNLIHLLSLNDHVDGFTELRLVMTSMTVTSLNPLSLLSALLPASWIPLFSAVSRV